MTSFCKYKSRLFNEAAQRGDFRLVRALSRDPEVDLNLQGQGGFLYTPFHTACYYGHVDIVRYFLDFTERPIELNPTELSGATPFSLACSQGHEGVVAMLLGDKRINVNRVNLDNRSPLWWAVRYQNQGITKRILASGRSEGEKLYDFDSRLLRDYQENPKDSAAKWGAEVRASDTGELFALVVYLTDGYLEPSSLPEFDVRIYKAKRFLSIASQLPQDLQMVLCNRAVGSMGLFVKSECSEKGFRKFAKTMAL